MNRSISNQIIVGENQLTYSKVGSGNQIILAFHGFGQERDLFLEIAEKKPSYTFFLFDLFYHGSSIRPDQPLTKEEWKKVISEFLIKEKIDKFSLLGFSLGGRFAISTAYEFAEKVEKLILIAPDGIFKSIWYRLSVSFWFRPVFKVLMNKYSLFNNIIDIIESLRIANRSLTNFARKELGDPANRIRVYRSWVYLVPLGYKMNKLAEKLKHYKIPVTFVLGTRDNIVPEKEIKAKTKGFKTAIYFDFPAKHHELLQTHILNQIIS